MIVILHLIMTFRALLVFDGLFFRFSVFFFFKSVIFMTNCFLSFCGKTVQIIGTTYRFMYNRDFF